MQRLKVADTAAAGGAAAASKAVVPQSGGETSECPVCMDSYAAPPSQHVPMNLPCGHSVCKLCISKMQTVALQQRRGGEPPKVRCPECRRMLALPPGGVGALPCNYGLMQMLGAGAAAAVRAEKQTQEAEAKAEAAEKEKDALEREMATLLAAAERQQIGAERKAELEAEGRAKEGGTANFPSAQEAGEKVVAVIADHEETDRLAVQMKALLAAAEQQQVQRTAQQRPAVPIRWQVSSTEIADVKVLGEGTFSTVWEVEYQGSRVAFKRLRGNGAEARAKVAELGREARGLMKAQHPNVVTLLGVTMNDPFRSGLLMELAERGTLKDVIDAAAMTTTRTSTGTAVVAAAVVAGRQPYSKRQATCTHWALCSML